jgi:hypothetical protein
MTRREIGASMSEPTTEAGKRLYQDLAFAAPELWSFHIDRRIEEAIAAERARIAAKVEGLPAWDKRSVPGGFHNSRAAVLAIVNPEAER